MALTRITKGVIKPNENYDTHNINSTGIVTAIGLDVNGNGDISGNLSVGGVLTYEDVTSIDSVGIITAQSDVHVGGGVSAVGVGTFGSLDISGDIDVDGHTNLDNVNVGGATTTNGVVVINAGTQSTNKTTGALRVAGGAGIQGNVNVGGDLDVDGHTNLDNVSIAGVTTASGNIVIENTEPSIFFTDTNANPDYKIFNDSGALKVYDTTYNATRLQIGPTNGEVTIASNTYFPNGITMNPGTASVVNTIAQKIGDTDTKIRFPAADTFSVETAGSERLRITSTGQTLLTRGSQGGRDSTGNASNWMKIGTWYGIDQTSRLKITVFGTMTYDSNADVAGETIIYLSNNANNTMKGNFHTVSHQRGGVQKVAFLLQNGNTEAQVWIKYNGGYSSTQHKVDASEGYWVGADVDTGSISVPSGATEATAHYGIWVSDGTQSYERLRIDSDGRVIIANSGSGGTADTNADNFVVKNYNSSSSCGISILNSDNQNSTLYFGNASDTKHAEVVWSDAANLFLIGSSNSGASIKLRSADQSDAVIIDSSQRVGIGTMIPDTLVEIGNAIGTGTANLLKLTSYTNSQSSRPALVFWNNNPNTAQAQISAKGGASYNASKLFFSVANSSRALQDRVCIDEYGTFIIGPGESRRQTKGSNQHQVLLIEGTGNNSTRMSMIRSSNDDNGPEIQLIKTRGTSIGSVTKPNQNDYIGAITFLAGDDSDLYARGADIGVQATGTPANDRVPCDIIFSTTPTSGATSPQEALRITSEGRVGIDKPSNVAAKLNIGDTNNDGALSQLIKLGNDSSGTGTGSQINLGLVHGNESTSACIAGFLDSGGGTSFIVKTAGTYANQSTVAERLRIYNSGRILIGNGSIEQSPSGNLDIVGDTNSNGPELYLRVSNNNTTDNIGALIFGNNVDKTVCMIRGSTHTANNTGDIEFHTSTSGTMKEKVRIFNDGRVRIQGEENSGNQMYLDIIGNSQTETAGLRLAGCRFIGPESRRMYFEIQGNDPSDHFRFITSPNNDRALDSVALHIGNNNRIGMSQTDPDAATLHIGNSYATTSSNVALQVGTISGQNRYLTINHFNNQQNFYQMKMRCNDNSLIPMLDMGNPYGSNGHGTKIKFSGYGDNEVGAIEAVNTANNSSTSVDMVHRAGGTKEVLRLQSNGDARFYNGLFIAKVDNDNSGFSRSGYVLGTPAINEFVYTWSGHSSYTIDLTCASYFSCIWEYFQHQTNGGSRMQQYARGKWSNNHYQHTLNVWEWSGSGGGLSVSFTASDQSGNGSINGLSNMSTNGSTYSGYVNGGGEGSSNTANGRFRISETYNWGSVSSRALIVRVSYGSFNISKS